MRWIPAKLKAVPALVLLAASSAAALVAQAAPLTLSQVLSDLSGAPVTKKTESAVAEASWKRVEAFSGFLPSVRVGANHLIDSQFMVLDVPMGGQTFSIAQVMPTTIYNLNLNWSVFEGFAGVNRFQSAKSFEHAAEAESEWTRFNNQHEAILLYYKALAAKTLREVAEQNERALQDHLNDAKLFKKAGISTNFDLLRVEVQLSEARSEVANARDNEAMAVLRLGELTNQHYDGFEVAGQLPVLDPKLADGLNAESVSRKDLEALGERVTGFERLSSAAEKDWVPRVALYAEYDRYNNRSNSLDYASSDFRDAHSVGVQLSWTLFDGFASTSQRHVASEKRVQAEYDLAIMKEKARNFLEFWKRKYSYFCGVYHARTDDVAKATESVRLAKEGRKVGARTNTDLLDAESELFRARAGLVNSQLGTIEALINLELATGKQLHRFD